ncbi:hypothetical protein [Telluria beijingensis]|uniref:hypothetical protein n=1 Tax=Telluria beijingensis TaxID=3068633 RepID=UPI002795D31B|nr:hypothetical protein [Massilia sp. REN29]
MRPSDENQDNRMHAHMRPNLMSSPRRGGREDSILARLEREPARRAGASQGMRLAWYGAASVVAMGLTATLAWLAAGTGPAPLEMAVPDAPAPVASAPPAPVETAVIVDAAPVPPLRLLEPAPAAPAPVLAAPPVVARTASPRIAAQARPRAQATRPAPRQAARPARTVNPARAGEAQDDSDVALISAVIYHANGHAAPAEDEAPAVPPAR